MKSEGASRRFELIEAVNIGQKYLKHFVQTMAFEENLQQHTHLNKMVFQRGNIELF